MKKIKVFFQLNIGWQLFSLFWLILSGLAGYYLVFSFLNKAWFTFLLMMFPFCFVLFTFIRFEHHRIVFFNKYISIPDDWLGMRSKIQFTTIIHYDEIEDVRIIWSENNSVNDRIPIQMPSSLILKPYIEIMCKDGNTKRIFIMYFTRKQKIKIIDEIKSRVYQSDDNRIFQDTLEIVDKPHSGRIII